MRIVIVMVGLAALVSGASFAAEPRPTPPDVLHADAGSPWARGVSQQARRQAAEHFDQGLRLAKDARYAHAVEAFRRAIAIWDHPAIHVDLAKALMSLDQSADALAHFWTSMRHGAEALDADRVEQAERYAKALLETKVALLVLRTDVPGVSVRIGTKVVLPGPGSWHGVVRLGAQEIIAQKAGALPEVVLARSFAAGLRSEVAIRPAPAGGRPPRALEAVVSERAPTDADMRLVQRQLVGFEVLWPLPVGRLAPSGGSMPARVAAICAKAKGDTAAICAEYEALHDQVERSKAEAQRRFTEQTRGGVVDTLR